MGNGRRDITGISCYINQYRYFHNIKARNYKPRLPPPSATEEKGIENLFYELAYTKKTIIPKGPWKELRNKEVRSRLIKFIFKHPNLLQPSKK